MFTHSGTYQASSDYITLRNEQGGPVAVYRIRPPELDKIAGDLEYVGTHITPSDAESAILWHRQQDRLRNRQQH